jgi:hypothetical protein
MTDPLLGDEIWILIRMQKQYETSITRVAKCGLSLVTHDPARNAATYWIKFYDHPLGLSCYWRNIKHGDDVVVELLRDVAEHMTFKFSSDRNDWTVSTEIIDEDEAVECRIALEVV